MLKVITTFLSIVVLSVCVKAQENSEADNDPKKTIFFNEYRNLYFGDTHVHTALSFDSYIFGNRIGMDQTYQFAQGKPIVFPNGKSVQLSRPLDFVVLTDHAESFGLFETCEDGSLTDTQKAYCQGLYNPTRETFTKMVSDVIARPPRRLPGLCGENVERCITNANSTFARVKEAADRNNIPGHFTAFIGYEYSPPLPKGGFVHRNVIFKNSNAPEQAYSAFDAHTVLDLWRLLEKSCTEDCEFLTIPHNMNRSWGIIYNGHTIDGDPYTKEDWLLRRTYEPLAEVFRVKGNSECGFGVGASDEECNFELMAPICDGEQKVGCSGRYSFVRQGLKRGLELETELGFNPLQVGMIGSTDTHFSLAGDTEEWDFIGATPARSNPRVRLGLNQDLTRTAADNKEVSLRNPGGLAAVWAKENTRDSIFEAMQNRETYATSGTRIKMRFFASWDFDKNLPFLPDLVEKAYDQGVPMGGILAPQKEATSPEFFIWAVKDYDSANLQKVQVIKGWVEDGKSHEQVWDVACSDQTQPDPKTGKCPDNGAKVDFSDCSYSTDKGNQSFKLTWRDPDYDSNNSAFYYVRVLENPTCRWSTHDALSLGVRVPDGLPLSIQERAWSSPIWLPL